MTQKIDITRAIAPKSDQLNADDLLTGPRTIRIRDVVVARGEQPVHVYFDGDDGKPWKPAKTALRTLAAVWGPNASKWIGMHCTIYNDESVTWAGVAVDGIRVSHMEGLTQPRTLMLTKTRGKKSAVTIQPLDVRREGANDRIRARLFQVAETGEMSVDDAWGKLKPEQREALGDAVLDQARAMEAAAAEHRATDPNATVDQMNAAINDDPS